MDIGLVIPHFTHHGSRSAIDRVLETADEAGWASLWAQDHVVFPRDVATPYPYGAAGANRIANRRHRSSGPAVNWWEVNTVLSYAAARTSRVALGTSVLVLPYRGALFTAKSLATIDRLSGGRVICGVGVGWMREEFEALGVGDWFARRGAVTDEYLQVMEKAWRDDLVSFAGEFLDFPEVSVTPHPEGGSIPIWVGGNGRRAWRRTARFGSGWMPLSLGTEKVRQAREGLDRELEEAGRDPSEVATALRCRVLPPGYSLAEPTDLEHGESFLTGTVAEIIEKIGGLAAAGVSHLILDPWVTATAPEAMEIASQVAAEVLPSFGSASRGAR